MRPTAGLDRELHWLPDRKQSGTAGWNAPRVAGTADVPRSGTPGPKESMSQKHRRSNRETKKPKQNKAKVVVSTSPFASASSNPAKAIAAKRK